MQEKTLDEMTAKFVKFATDTFSRPSAGDVFTKMKIGHIVTKIFMALGITPTMFDSAPLKRGLEEFFGEKTRLFSMARERKHQCSTRVAVVAATDTGGTKCLIASYNRPDLSECSDFEREDDDELGMKIWEAALATSAAPLYLPPFKKLETKKEYVDGALYANCPAETALREFKLLWPENGASLDILLSLGTGRQNNEMKVLKTPRIGGLAELFRSFHNNLNTEKLWQNFLQTDAAKAVKSRLRRLNPDINKLGHVSIFHFSKMAALQSLVREQTSETRQSEEVQGIADTLLANLFFFEPGDENVGSSTSLSVHGTSSLKGPVALNGTIRCRLRHNSVELIKLLSQVQAFSYGVLPEHCRSHTVELPSNMRWKEVEDFRSMRAEIQNNKRRFRVPVSLKGAKESRAPHVLAVKMKRRPDEWIPISGFPVRLGELVRRANCNSP